jgi:hypothetical protein
MDSTTLLGLAGIVGTLLGTAVGAGGTFGAARVTSRGQADVEEQKARRQAYGACATVLLARRDAAAALLEAFREDSFDPAAGQTLLQNLDAQRDGVARAVGRRCCRRSGHSRAQRRVRRRCPRRAGRPAP